MAVFLTWSRRDFYQLRMRTKGIILAYVFFCDFAYIKQNTIVRNSVKNLTIYYTFLNFLFNGKCHMHPINFFFFDVSRFNFFLPGSFFFTRKYGDSRLDIRSSFIFFYGNVFLHKAFLYYSIYFFFFSKQKLIIFDLFFFIFLNFYVSFFFLLNGNVQSNSAFEKEAST